MTGQPATPPMGTVRDWLRARADAGGVAIVFPETGEQLDWAELVLEEATEALHYRTLCRMMIEQGWETYNESAWTGLHVALSRDIRSRGTKSRFKRSKQPGFYELRKRRQP